MSLPSRPAGGTGLAAPAVVLLASVAAISWAAPLVRFTDANPLVISFWRLTLSLPIVAAIVSYRQEWEQLRRISRCERTLGVIAGVFLAAHFWAWIASVQFTSIAASVALVATQPIWVALLAMATLGERPTRGQWVGIGGAVIGAGIIGLGDMGGGTRPLLGDAFAVLGALFVAVYYVIGRRIRSGLGTWPYVAMVYGVAAVTLLVIATLAGVPLLSELSRSDWLVFAALAAGPMLIGHTGQNYALGHLPAYAVNLTLLGEPIGATLIAWSLPGIAETPSPAVLAGGALVLFGILLGLGRRA